MVQWRITCTCVRAAVGGNFDAPHLGDVEQVLGDRERPREAEALRHVADPALDLGGIGGRFLCIEGRLEDRGALGSELSRSQEILEGEGPLPRAETAAEVRTYLTERLRKLDCLLGLTRRYHRESQEPIGEVGLRVQFDGAPQVWHRLFGPVVGGGVGGLTAATAFAQRGVEVERKWKRPDYRMPGTATFAR
jgi:hypothetical protein